MPKPKVDAEVHAARCRTVRDFIVRHTKDRGYPPSMREIAHEMGTSTSTAHTHIQRMIDEGLLIGHPGIARQIRVTETVLPEIGETL